jgi:hypothetical protein
LGGICFYLSIQHAKNGFSTEIPRHRKMARGFFMNLSAILYRSRRLAIRQKNGATNFPCGFFRGIISALLIFLTPFQKKMKKQGWLSLG